jgi:DNA invertase Pin-like site-specific DNA recombinase
MNLSRIGSTTPMGKLVFQVTGPFAEFERSMMRQRVKAGLKRALAQGVKLGRPKIDSATERKVRKQLAKGVGYLEGGKVARDRDWHGPAHLKRASLKAHYWVAVSDLAPD